MQKDSSSGYKRLDLNVQPEPLLCNPTADGFWWCRRVSRLPFEQTSRVKLCCTLARTVTTRLEKVSELLSRFDKTDLWETRIHYHDSWGTPPTGGQNVKRQSVQRCRFLPRLCLQCPCLVCSPSRTADSATKAAVSHRAVKQALIILFSLYPCCVLHHRMNRSRGGGGGGGRQFGVIMM